jgi:hypothetical protein
MISTIINSTTNAIGFINPIQSSLEPLGEFWVACFNLGYRKNSIATNMSADVILSQSIIIHLKKNRFKKSGLKIKYLGYRYQSSPENAPRICSNAWNRFRIDRNRLAVAMM